MTEELNQTQLNHLHAAIHFEHNRERILQTVLPLSLFKDLREERHTEFHSESPFIHKDLRRLLPFGTTITSNDNEILVNLTAPFRVATRQQLLAWYLHRTPDTPGQPVTQLSIYYEADQFWFGHVLPNRARITQRLLTHNPVHFLQRFLLNHTHLELEIAELRLITNRPEILPFLDEGNVAWTIVHTPGITHKFTFHTNAWETTDHFPSSQLVDPPIPYFLPPTTPSPGFQAVPELQINYYTAFLDHASHSRQILLHDSDLESDTDADTNTTLPALEEVDQTPSGWEPTDNRPAHQSQRCFCAQELCRCGYRPNTPPTPPHITLWTPGDKHLPWRN